jgi:peptidoglycan/LPS O-acetylase OafA/YrhL
MNLYNKSISWRLISKRHFWMDWMRAYAILTIILHHWILFFYEKTGIDVIDKLMYVILSVSGNSIHLFFILSGAGLAVSYLSKPIPWSQWYIRRLKKIIGPFWITVLLMYIFVNLTHLFIPSYFKVHLAFADTLHNLFLTRNFVDSATQFNLSLWFIPNIVGLYCIFPLLVVIFHKTNIAFLSILSFIISVGSIMFFVFLGMKVDNLHSIFLFFVFEFSFGFIIGHLSLSHQSFVNKKNTILLLALGILFYFVSYVLVSVVSWGGDFNKLFTALGIFLIIYALIGLFRSNLNNFSPVLAKISHESYFIYLIHFPIIYYFLKPLIAQFPQPVFLRIVILTISYFAFCVIVFYLSMVCEFFGNKFRLT